MINHSWMHLTSDCIIEVIHWRTGFSITVCAALYELVIRDFGYDLFLDLYDDGLVV